MVLHWAGVSKFMNGQKRWHAFECGQTLGNIVYHQESLERTKLSKHFPTQEKPQSLKKGKPSSKLPLRSY